MTLDEGERAGRSSVQNASMPAVASGLLLARLERVALVSTRILSVLGLVALMVLAFVTLANGLLRWLVNQPIAGVVDVGALAIAIAVSCCMPVALMERSHITFRLVSSLSPAVGKVFDLFADIAVAIVLALMAWQFWVYAAELVVSGERTYVLKIPAAPFWFAADVILWIAVAVQIVVVALDAGHLAGVHAAPTRTES
jgi:TRAP-type C4-dicarboxylate transport system permease small subunit